MKYFSILGLCIISVISMHAQTITPCYTKEVIDNYEVAHPGYKLKVQQAFEQAKLFAEEYKSSRGVNADTLYKIPVVVHIVHTSPAENLPDSLIFSQIDVLNRDYNRWNDDAIQTRNVFKPIAGSMHIEFFLATTDPSGNPTTGIVRKVGTPAIPLLGFNAFQDNVKLGDEGDAAWDTRRYLNIWVCNLNTIPLGLLGYAYPPTGAANWPTGSETDSASQGVVIDYTAFGRNNPYVIDPGVVPGRTCVHEVGHYLGLRHIWADEAACAEDDGIDDTPMAGDQTSFTCDTTKNTCVDVGIDYPDMIENYMDYSDERCQNMFTVGQTDIMLANLITLRPDLAQKTVVGVGMAQQNLENSVHIYPNPCADLLYIAMKNTNASLLQAEMINCSGSKVVAASFTALESTHSLDIRTLDAGVYFLKISDGTSSTWKKIVKY